MLEHSLGAGKRRSVWNSANAGTDCMLAYSRVSVSETPGRTGGNTRPPKIRLARTVITGYWSGGSLTRIRFRKNENVVHYVNFEHFFTPWRHNAPESGASNRAVRSG